MGFESLPPQPPIFPAEAADYARKALDLSWEAAQCCDVDRDLAYGPDPRQRLDVYRAPGESRRGLPVLVFIHGGGWTNGYKEWVGLLAPAVTAFPAVFVSVSCRLAPDHRLPVPFDDCVRAIGWIHRTIADYGGDPESLFVGGHSSGGHLTALATLRPDRLEAEGIPADAIRACLPVSARFDLVFDEPEPGTVEHRHQSVLFAPGQDATPVSPFHQIGANRTPFLLAYGSRDMPSIISNNERMYDALLARGLPVESLVLDDHDHFDTALETRHADHPWTARVRKMMLGGIGDQEPAG